MPASGGEPQQITKHGADNACFSIDGKTLYFEVLDPSLGLFSISLAGGEERKLVGSINERSYAVAKDGIYYTRKNENLRKNELCLLEPATLKNCVIAVLEGSLCQGLAVSPDGKTIVYTRSKDTNVDLMLVENFR